MSNASRQIGLPWHIVEEAVNRESDWLRSVIDQSTTDKMPGCDDCRYTFKKIALLIVTDKVKAKEFTARNGCDLWDGLTQKHSAAKSVWHGGDWHRRMMEVIVEYFERDGFEVISEPFLSNGRADLGIYKDRYMDLFVEIGSTSIYKLWWNLNTLQDCKILLVTSENQVVEFTCDNTGVTGFLDCKETRSKKCCPI